MSKVTPPWVEEESETVKVKEVVPALPSSCDTSLMESVGVVLVCALTKKSSTARPSSAPVASTSLKRMKKVEPFGMLRPVMVEERAVRLAALSPTSAPAEPAVTGGLKSSAFACKYVPVDKSVALRLY